MNAVILEKDLILVIFAVQRLLNKLISYTTSALILAKNLLSVVYAAVALVRLVVATFIRHVVAARGSRFMKNA